jgi:hypothetical protein
MLLTIMSLVLYAWVIGGVVGMELWAGAVSHHCLDPASQDALAAGLVVTDCPRMTRCELPMQCFAAVPPDIGALHEVQVRGNHLDKIGFDTIGMSFITEFQITIQDDWPELVQVSHISCVSRVFCVCCSHFRSSVGQPLVDSGTSTAMLARPVAMVFVCMVSLISVNLFLASMTHSYLTVRQDSRSLRENTEHKSLQQQLAELRMDAQLGEDGGDGPKYSFPMHRKCTPTCKDIANSSKFEALFKQSTHNFVILRKRRSFVFVFLNFYLFMKQKD